MGARPSVTMCRLEEPTAHVAPAALEPPSPESSDPVYAVYKLSDDEIQAVKQARAKEQGG